MAVIGRPQETARGGGEPVLVMATVGMRLVVALEVAETPGSPCRHAGARAAA